jgi:HD-like signal output (HDOD) protein
MNATNAILSGPDQVAAKIIEKSGVLTRAAIIGDLNVEKEREQSTYEHVIAAIQRDAPLTQRVLHLSNSAWFGGRVKVNKVEDAFGRLGVKDFYKVSVAAALRFHLGDGAENERWWQESESVAHVCEMTAQQLNPALVESAFFAGLFRDCAVPLMRKHVPDFSYLVNDAMGFDPASVEVEFECNQTDHATAAALLVNALKFPPANSVAVRHHHARMLAGAETDDARQLLAILLLGARIHAWAGRGIAAFHEDPAEESLQSEIALAFRVTKQAVNDVIAEMIALYQLRRANG